MPCLKASYPKLKVGVIIVADNIRADRADVTEYVAAVHAESTTSSVALTVGRGIEISRLRCDPLTSVSSPWYCYHELVELIIPRY